MQVIFVKEGNVVKRTGIYVKDVDTEELEQVYNRLMIRNKNSVGEIESRAMR